MRQEQEVNERLCLFDKYIPVMQVLSQPAFQFYCSSSSANERKRLPLITVLHTDDMVKDLRVIITIIITFKLCVAQFKVFKASHINKL